MCSSVYEKPAITGPPVDLHLFELISSQPYGNRKDLRHISVAGQILAHRDLKLPDSSEHAQGC